MKTNERAVVIGFDGIHRSGKGRQIALLESVLQVRGSRVLTVRGDGRREGRGLSPGDPYDITWQHRSHHLASPNATVNDWHASAYSILHEMHGHAHSGRYDIVIADRTLVSRAALLITDGVLPREGNRFSLDELYPVRDHIPVEERISIEEAVPDVVCNLVVPSRDTALSRLAPDDPKYAFRLQNISETFESYMLAPEMLPETVAGITYNLAADRPVPEIHQEVIGILGAAVLL